MDNQSKFLLENLFAHLWCELNSLEDKIITNWPNTPTPNCTNNFLLTLVSKSGFHPPYGSLPRLKISNHINNRSNFSLGKLLPRLLVSNIHPVRCFCTILFLPFLIFPYQFRNCLLRYLNYPFISCILSCDMISLDFSKLTVNANVFLSRQFQKEKILTTFVYPHHLYTVKGYDKTLFFKDR